MTPNNKTLVTYFEIPNDFINKDKVPTSTVALVYIASILQLQCSLLLLEVLNELYFIIYYFLTLIITHLNRYCH